VLRLTQLLREAATQVNLLTEGRVAAVYNAQPTIPTQGQNAVGDFVRNSAPVELGVAASKYVVFGWVCTVAGTPGTWLPVRTLTGN